MYSSETTIRVRYAETDQMGYVYYGNYATYFEVARVESLRQLGLTYSALEASGIMMPVLENHSVYHAPARYDELLRIVTSVAERLSVRVRFMYAIYNEAGTLIHEGYTALAFVSLKTGRPCRPPQQMTILLEPFFK